MFLILELLFHILSADFRKLSLRPSLKHPNLFAIIFSLNILFNPCDTSTLVFFFLDL